MRKITPSATNFSPFHVPDVELRGMINLECKIMECSVLKSRNPVTKVFLRIFAGPQSQSLQCRHLFTSLWALSFPPFHISCGRDPFPMRNANRCDVTGMNVQLKFLSLLQSSQVCCADVSWIQIGKPNSPGAELCTCSVRPINSTQNASGFSVNLHEPPQREIFCCAHNLSQLSI